jgi:toxin ParE1/3/4
VPERRDSHKAVLSPEARRDLREILKWSQVKFGRDAALRYEDLIIQALRDIETDLERPGSQERRELQKGVRTYHLSFSRERARTTLGVVQNPRHFLVYRRRDGLNVIDILRILHDGRDLARHLPKGYQRMDDNEK